MDALKKQKEYIVTEQGQAQISLMRLIVLKNIKVERKLFYYVNL